MPVLSLLQRVITRIRGGNSFPGTKEYWENRYRNGGNSGPGSYDQLSVFKAEFLNDFVSKNNIRTVVEFGCGDGNQLKLAHYPQYLGLDISETALAICRESFINDTTKKFELYNPGQKVGTFEMVLSLDVIFHLVEDLVFRNYLSDLFMSSEKYVVIYSCNMEDTGGFAPHVKPRKFTEYISTQYPEWKLIQHVPNKWPVKDYGPEKGSWSEFFVYAR